MTSGKDASSVQKEIKVAVILASFVLSGAISLFLYLNWFEPQPLFRWLAMFSGVALSVHLLWNMRRTKEHEKN